MTNYRWGGYLLIALGLINLRYQTGHSNVLTHSLLIVIPGALILLMSWLAPTKKILEMKVVKYISLVILVALIAYAAINK
ncbi:MAG: hypothetical protein NTZ31_06255 [Actinobacteria bacterium]|nr:hypothetical protein [Actinomycetota bacterium]